MKESRNDGFSCNRVEAGNQFLFFSLDSLSKSPDHSFYFPMPLAGTRRWSSLKIFIFEFCDPGRTPVFQLLVPLYGTRNNFEKYIFGQSSIRLFIPPSFIVNYFVVKKFENFQIFDLSTFFFNQTFLKPFRCRKFKTTWSPTQSFVAVKFAKVQNFPLSHIL